MSAVTVEYVAIVCTIVALATGLARAEGTAGDAPASGVPPWTLESDAHRFVLRYDGTLEERDEKTLRANTAAGVDAIAQQYVWFDKDTERLTILAAESIDPDGRAYAVGPEAIRDVEEPRAAGAPRFDSGLLRTVIFPRMGPGWRVHLVFAKTRTVPIERGVFSYYVEPTREPVEDQQLVFDLPADMPLFADARGYVAEPAETEDGRTRYRFRYRHGPYAPIERGAVGYAQTGDRLMVTTLPDFAAFAERYRSGSADPSADDPAVAALALRLTAGSPDTWSKARAVYDWVRMNIRYVALFVGQTVARPHRVADVLRDRYGDCKDHVALFVALLRAAGIRAQPALIALGNVYTLPSVPGYGASAINHIIVWIPDVGRFADTTAGGGIAFGDLPAGVMDRPALLVDDGAMTRTPPDAERSRDARMQLEVDERGHARYAYRVEDSGWTAELERNVFRRATRERVQQIGGERLRQGRLRGTAQVVTGDVAATSGPFAVSMTGTIDRLIRPDGMAGLPLLSSLPGGIATQVDGWLGIGTRTQPFICTGGSFDETGQVALPSAMRIVFVPGDTIVVTPSIRYESHYIADQASGVVQVTRRLRASFDGQVCSPHQFESMRAALEQIERDADSQLIVRGVPQHDAAIRDGVRDGVR